MLQQLSEAFEPAVCADLVRAIILRTCSLDLEGASLVLPALALLLHHEGHQLLALEALAQLTDTFGPLITANRAVAQDVTGVDLSAEARQQRCQACFEQFSRIRTLLQRFSAESGPAGASAASLRVKLQHVLGID